MAQSSPGHGGKPTSATLRELRADALHRLLLTDRGRVQTVDDIALLPDLAAWPGLAVAIAIADLAGDGLILEESDGGLRVTPLEAS